METKLLSNSENDLNIAAEIIRSGGTVVFIVAPVGSDIYESI